MDSWPVGADRYLVPDGEHTGWRGAKFYGRPVWTSWMQRAVWERAYGVLPPKSRVSETCDVRGCLTLEHLKITERPPRTPRTICRKCGGVLSRDRNAKTYCQQCNRLRSRTYRKERRTKES